MFPNLAVYWSEAKLARARRKQVLLAKGLSHSRTIGMNARFHLLHYSNTRITNSTVNMIVAIYTSDFHFIVIMQVYYKL